MTSPQRSREPRRAGLLLTCYVRVRFVLIDGPSLMRSSFLRKVLASCMAVFVAGVTALAAAEPEPRTPYDLEELAVALPETPGLEASLKQADAAFEARDFRAAAELYAEAARATHDELGYPLRRRCEALTELGQRAEALRACKAMQSAIVSSAADLSALVGALMSGTEPLTSSDLMTAKLLLQRAQDLEPDSIFALASECDVARRIGDRATFANCARQLRQVAPDHRLTRRVLKADAGAPNARAWQLLLLGLVALASAATLAHRMLVGRRKGRTAAVLAAHALLFGWVSSAHAQAVGIVEEPADPNAATYSGPPSKAELEHDQEVGAFKDEMKQLNELMEQVNSAEKLIEEQHDWLGGIKIYNQVVTTIPYFVKGWRRLCEGYSAVGMPVEGAHACRQVLASKESNAWDRAMLVHHLLSGPEGKAQATRAEAKQLADDAVRLAPNERWGYDATCELALAQSDRVALSSCSKKLAELAPDDRKSLAFAWALAISDNRLDAASHLLDDARRRGLDEATLARMQREIDARQPLIERLKRRAPLGLAAGAAAALLVLGVSRVWRRRRPLTAPAS